MSSSKKDEPSREEILRRRAERLAAEGSSAEARAVAVQAAVVSAGAVCVAIPAEEVRELVPLPDITELPGLPPWLLGIAQVRGELLGVVDLSVVIGAARERPQMMAIVEGSGGPLGLALSSVIGFRDIYVDELATELGEDADRPFWAITRDLVAVLDVHRLPAAPGDAA